MTKMIVELAIGTLLKTKDNKAYEILGSIGTGGSSIVYEAGMKYDRYIIKEHVPFNLDLKISREHDGSIHSSDDDSYHNSLEDFRNEYKRVADLTNQNHLINAIDLIEANKTCYIVMPKNSGILLKDYLRDNQVSFNEVLEIIIKLVESLKFLHDMDLYHLDLSPSNILLEWNKKELRVKLFDFGSSRKANSIDAFQFYTNGFSAPEIYNNHPYLVNFTTDLYSIFAILYRLIKGHTFYSQNETMEYAIFTDKAFSKENFITQINFRDETLSSGTLNVLNSLMEKGLIVESEKRADSLHSIDWVISELERLRKLHNSPSDFDYELLIDCSKAYLKNYHHLTKDYHDALLVYSDDSGMSLSQTNLLQLLLHENIILEGIGGMGKTTSLVKLWQSTFELGILPLFVELHDYNSSFTATEYIIKSILKNYYFKNGDLSLKDIDGSTRDNQIALSNLLSQLSERRIVLLLDGYNEIKSHDQLSFIHSIKETIDSWQNTSFVITTRVAIGSLDFRVLKMPGINKKDLRILLGKDSMSMRNQFELLRIPLYFKLYLELRNLNYTVSEFSRGMLMEEYLRSLLQKKHTTSQHKFILDHVMPFIGSKMHHLELYEITSTQLTTFVSEAINRMKYMTLHDMYIDHRLNFDTEITLSSIKNILLHESSFMRISNNKFQLLHQDFRDYYAAKDLSNLITIVTHIKSGDFLLSKLNDYILHRDLLSLLSDIHPKFERALDIYRNHKKNKFATRNILYTLVLQYKNELWDIDFSNLDFKNCSLIGIKFSNGHTASPFNGSHLYDYNFENTFRNGKAPNRPNNIFSDLNNVYLNFYREDQLPARPIRDFQASSNTVEREAILIEKYEDDIVLYNAIVDKNKSLPNSKHAVIRFSSGKKYCILFEGSQVQIIDTSTLQSRQFKFDKSKFDFCFKEYTDHILFEHESDLSEHFILVIQTLKTHKLDFLGQEDVSFGLSYLGDGKILTTDPVSGRHNLYDIYLKKRVNDRPIINKSIYKVFLWKGTIIFLSGFALFKYNESDSKLHFWCQIQDSVINSEKDFLHSCTIYHDQLVLLTANMIIYFDLNSKKVLDSISINQTNNKNDFYLTNNGLGINDLIFDIKTKSLVGYKETSTDLFIVNPFDEIIYTRDDYDMLMEDIKYYLNVNEINSAYNTLFDLVDEFEGHHIYHTLIIRIYRKGISIEFVKTSTIMSIDVSELILYDIENDSITRYPNPKGISYFTYWSEHDEFIIGPKTKESEGSLYFLDFKEMTMSSLNYHRNLFIKDSNFKDITWHTLDEVSFRRNLVSPSNLSKGSLDVDFNLMFQVIEMIVLMTLYPILAPPLFIWEKIIYQDKDRLEDSHFKTIKTPLFIARELLSNKYANQKLGFNTIYFKIFPLIRSYGRTKSRYQSYQDDPHIMNPFIHKEIDSLTEEPIKMLNCWGASTSTLSRVKHKEKPDYQDTPFIFFK